MVLPGKNMATLHTWARTVNFRRWGLMSTGGSACKSAVPWNISLGQLNDEGTGRHLPRDLDQIIALNVRKTLGQPLRQVDTQPGHGWQRQPAVTDGRLLRQDFPLQRSLDHA